MAKYRTIKNEFWEDPYILDLTPEEDRFYFYLLTNPYTTQTGIYTLPLRIAEVHLKHSRDKIIKLIKKFEADGKIRYNFTTQEIAIKNWAKYNFNDSGNILICINREVKDIKDKTLIPFVYDNFEYYKNFIPLINSLQGAYKVLTRGLDTPTKKEIEIEKEIKEEIEIENIHVENSIFSGSDSEISFSDLEEGEKPTKEQSLPQETPVESIMPPKKSKKPLNGRRAEKLNALFVQEFEEDIWPFYPRKESKEGAMIGYCFWREKGIDKIQLQSATQGYKRKVDSDGTESRYVKLGSTFYSKEVNNWECFVGYTPANEKKLTNYEKAAMRDPDDILREAGLDFLTTVSNGTGEIIETTGKEVS